EARLQAKPERSARDPAARSAPAWRRRLTGRYAILGLQAALVQARAGQQCQTGYCAERLAILEAAAIQARDRAGGRLVRVDWREGRQSALVHQSQGWRANPTGGAYRVAARPGSRSR